MHVAITSNRQADIVANAGTLPDCHRVRPKELCAMLGISPVTLWRWVSQEKLPTPMRLSYSHTSWSLGQIRQFIVDAEAATAKLAASRKRRAADTAARLASKRYAGLATQHHTTAEAEA